MGGWVGVWVVYLFGRPGRDGVDVEEVTPPLLGALEAMREGWVGGWVV